MTGEIFYVRSHGFKHEYVRKAKIAVARCSTKNRNLVRYRILIKLYSITGTQLCLSAYIQACGLYSLGLPFSPHLAPTRNVS